MESWKITIAEGVRSYSRSGKKDIKIVTNNKKTGKDVAQAIVTGVNASYPLSTDFKGISANQNNNWWWTVAAEALIGIPGAGASTVAGIQAINSSMKEFYVNTGSKQAQDEFIERLGKVIAEVNEYKNSAAAAVPEDTPRGLGNNTVLLIAAVLIVAALVWALWK